MAFLDLKPLIEAAAKAYGYDAALLAAQAHQESAFREDAVSPAGAMGLMQFMPATWDEWGRGGDPFDPEDSIDAGIRYMQMLLARYRGAADPEALALAAYNGGMGRVDAAIRKTGRTDWDGIVGALPAESQAYAPAILARRTFYRTIFKVGMGSAAVGLLALLAFFVARRVFA
ncbi:lytic transglycosylase domain-containing protein [Geothrix campi]|uniref:transglycosylase SLT domain-containing protein n=1 Tax=Geothrix campi TaxID=2966450 RepID=UPI0021485795|nr:lytic transglycosylase domain-containing protein [Geothrix sp. SG10]